MQYKEKILIYLLNRWLRISNDKLWDGEPICRGPGDLSGQPIALLRYNDLCDGKWASKSKYIIQYIN